MLGFGKTESLAIAAMSYLAELPEGRAASAREIGQARQVSLPHIAKILTRLSETGLISGIPGPGGGYRLSRPAGEITIADIVQWFGLGRTPVACPFGPGWCGKNDPCPLHDSMVALQIGRAHV